VVLALIECIGNEKDRVCSLFQKSAPRNPRPMPDCFLVARKHSAFRLDKNDKGDYETRTEWHRVYAWRNLSKFAKTLQKGQFITLEGTLRYREVEDEIEGSTFKHRIAEIHATSMKRLSKIEAPDDPSDGAGDE
jgi:single-stranded DNA-binding protein